MKRDIKFRGKRIDNGEWAYGKFLESNFNAFIVTMVNTLNGRLTDAVAHEVDPETVGQFTGLKTDTEISVYDGDIITVPELISLVNDFVDVVEFENGAFHLASATDILVCQELMDEGVSVIENKWDDPELLVK